MPKLNPGDEVLIDFGYEEEIYKVHSYLGEDGDGDKMYVIVDEDGYFSIETEDIIVNKV